MRISAFESSFGSAAESRSLISSGSQIIKFSLSSLGGRVYLIPGSTSLSRDISSSTRLMLSMTFPSSLIIIRLEQRPIISQARVTVTISPSSLTHSKSRKSILSRPSCLISVSFPLPRRFLRSIQNIGGVWGLSTLFSVICTLALPAFAEI